MQYGLALSGTQLGRQVHISAGDEDETTTLCGKRLELLLTADQVKRDSFCTACLKLVRTTYEGTPAEQFKQFASEYGFHFHLAKHGGMEKWIEAFGHTKQCGTGECFTLRLKNVHAGIGKE